MRYCDDISDSRGSENVRHNGLSDWRQALTNTMAGDYGKSEILAAFHDTVRRFEIPEDYFHKLIDGAEMDLSVNRYQTFEELYEYCYRVASVVGLVCIRIFGYRGEDAKEYAEYCGVAFQLTNILRDMKEDARRNRIYIPLEDLSAFGYSESDILSGVTDARFRNLMEFEVRRAKGYYQKATPLVNMVDLVSRPGLMAMIGIYSAILDKIESRSYDIFGPRVSLSAKEKISIAAKSMLKWHSNGGNQH